MLSDPRATLYTSRLELAELTLADTAFVLALVNEPLWLRFIGDRHVHTLEDARAYLLQGPLASYATHGFGLRAVTLKTTGMTLGMCGLLRRPLFDDVEIGFAFFGKFSGQGYATEAAKETLRYGWQEVGLTRITAITDVENHASIRVLEKCGLQFERNLPLPSDGKPGKLFAIHTPAARR